MTIKVDDQSCGPWCDPTLIIKVRLDGVILRDMIAESIYIYGGWWQQSQGAIHQADRSVCGQSPSHVGWLAGTCHNAFAGKYSPEDFNCCLERGSKFTIDRQVQNIKKTDLFEERGIQQPVKSQNNQSLIK